MTEFYKSVWFWLVIIGVILLIAGIIYYIVFINNKANANSKTPTTVWVLVGLGALLLVLGIIFAIFDSTPAVVVSEGPVTKVTTQEQIRIPLEPINVPVSVAAPIVAAPREPILSRRTTDYYELPDVQTQVTTRTTASQATAPIATNPVYYDEPVNRTVVYNPMVDPLAGRQVVTYNTAPTAAVVSPTNVVRQRVPVGI